MPDDDPSAVETVLRYLYLGDYNIDPHSDEGSERPMGEQQGGTQNPASAGQLGRTREFYSNTHAALGQVEVRLSRLRAHVLVNQVADKFNIETVKDLASEHFSAQLDTDCIDMKGFLDLVSLVYESTTVADKLRIKFTEFCLGNIAKLERDEKLFNAIKAYEPVAYAVGKVLLDRLAQMKLEDFQKDEVLREREDVIKEKDGRIKHLEKRMGSISAFGSPKGLNGFGGTRTMAGGFRGP